MHSQIHHEVVVVREAKAVSVDVLDLVPGDLVELHLGDIVPADLRLPTNRAGAAVTSTPQVLHGIGVSTGTATGPVLIVRAAPGPDPDEAATTDPALASGQVRAAMREVAAALTDQARTAPAAAAAILEATAAMAADRGLGKAVDKELATGSGLTRAVTDAVEAYSVRLRSLGGYLAERVTDLQDVPTCWFATSTKAASSSSTAHPRPGR